MSKKQDGGPAYPQPIHKHYHDTRPEDFDETGRGGMSLRKWLAGQALPAAIRELGKAQGIGEASFPRNVAIHAHRIADAMLEAE
jgi:hypothetical protein